MIRFNLRSTDSKRQSLTSRHWQNAAKWSALLANPSRVNALRRRGHSFDLRFFRPGTTRSPQHPHPFIQRDLANLDDPLLDDLDSPEHPRILTRHRGHTNPRIEVTQLAFYQGPASPHGEEHVARNIWTGTESTVESGQWSK